MRIVKATLGEIPAGTHIKEAVDFAMMESRLLGCPVCFEFRSTEVRASWGDAVAAVVGNYHTAPPSTFRSEIA